MNDRMPMPDAWIRVAETHVPAVGERPVYLLRREFELAALPAAAILRITAQGIYNAFINGVRVGDDELRPGFTQYAKRIEVQTYDVTSLLRQGANVIVVQLADGWIRGAYGILQVPDQWGSHVALLAALEVDQADGGDDAAIAIGAGIAGLSCASGLAAHGVEVDVVEIGNGGERSGSGITLLGNALRALGELELALAFDGCWATSSARRPGSWRATSSSMSMPR